MKGPCAEPRGSPGGAIPYELGVVSPQVRLASSFCTEEILSGGRTALSRNRTVPLP